MDLIISYLRDGKFPDDKLEVKRLRFKSARYTILQGMLYKRGCTAFYLRCLDSEEVYYVMQEIHESICENHSCGRALAHKIIRPGYYYPSLHDDP